MDLTRLDIQKILAYPREKNKEYNISLRGLNLKGIDLSGLDLSFCDFSNTDLSDANLENCILNNVLFNKSKLNNCRFYYTQIKNSLFENTDSSFASFAGSLFTKTKLIKTNLSYCVFSNVSIEDSEFYEVNFTEAKFGVKAKESTFRRILIRNCQLKNDRFEKCSISGSIKETLFETVTFLNTKINITQKNLNVHKCKFEASSFKSNGENLKFTFNNLKYSYSTDKTVLLQSMFDGYYKKSNISNNTIESGNFFGNFSNCLFENNEFISYYDSSNDIENVRDGWMIKCKNLDSNHELLSKSYYIDHKNNKAPFVPCSLMTIFENSKILNCNFSEADFSVTYGYKCFENCRVSNCNFIAASFNECSFTNTTFDEVKWALSNLHCTIFEQCKFNECNFHDAFISGSNLIFTNDDMVFQIDEEDEQLVNDARPCTEWVKEIVVSSLFEHNSLYDIYFEEDYKRSKKFFFFDLETTGLPRNFRGHYSDTDNWPYIVQIGLIETDEKGNIGKKVDCILKPQDYIIPVESSDIHGTTHEKAIRNGYPIKHVLSYVARAINDCDTIVAHNADFDINVLKSEFYRYGIDDKIDDKKIICTMKSATNYCAINNGRGTYKWPTLSELHIKLFGEDFEGAHDASADINATRECFWKLIELGVIDI